MQQGAIQLLRYQSWGVGQEIILLDNMMNRRGQVNDNFLTSVHKMPKGIPVIAEDLIPTLNFP